MTGFRDLLPETIRVKTAGNKHRRLVPTRPENLSGVFHHFFFAVNRPVVKPDRFRKQDVQRGVGSGHHRFSIRRTFVATRRARQPGQLFRSEVSPHLPLVFIPAQLQMEKFF
ncbi:MAG: hypothetical protein BWY44_00781 [Candidatus Omnitrophica bacterium ADurb.Bin292]|nr:MAG: hypothetical protein BWY44_00781 [Candidatus Omnitrophica bacterium ADurb.Bin292]